MLHGAIQSHSLCELERRTGVAPKWCGVESETVFCNIFASTMHHVTQRCTCISDAEPTV